MHLPILPRIVHWFVIGLFSAFVALLATSAYALTEVPSDWPLKPSGLSGGDEFRLMFMGKNSRAADSTDIAVYDAYVQGRIVAIGHAEIMAYSSHFKVLGSTATVNARTYIGTTETGGVPIYWLSGSKVADNYGDFYDGTERRRTVLSTAFLSQELRRNHCFEVSLTDLFNALNRFNLRVIQEAQHA